MEPDTNRIPAFSWAQFVEAEPELAGFGRQRLTAAPAYLATVRRSGAPRVHPVTPIFTDTGLFLYMEPTSPKGHDLRERERFAMHNGVPDNAGSGGEFSLAGRARPIDESEIWSEVASVASYQPAERYVLFELRLTEARRHGYGDVPMPATAKWLAGEM